MKASRKRKVDAGSTNSNESRGLPSSISSITRWVSILDPIFQTITGDTSVIPLDVIAMIAQYMQSVVVFHVKSRGFGLSDKVTAWEIESAQDALKPIGLWSLPCPTVQRYVQEVCASHSHRPICAMIPSRNDSATTIAISRWSIGRTLSFDPDHVEVWTLESGPSPPQLCQTLAPASHVFWSRKLQRLLCWNGSSYGLIRATDETSLRNGLIGDDLLPNDERETWMFTSFASSPTLLQLYHLLPSTNFDPSHTINDNDNKHQQPPIKGVSLSSAQMPLCPRVRILELAPDGDRLVGWSIDPVKRYHDTRLDDSTFQDGDETIFKGSLFAWSLSSGSHLWDMKTVNGLVQQLVFVHEWDATYDVVVVYCNQLVCLHTMVRYDLQTGAQRYCLGTLDDGICTESFPINSRHVQCDNVKEVSTTPPVPDGLIYEIGNVIAVNGQPGQMAQIVSLVRYVFYVDGEAEFTTGVLCWQSSDQSQLLTIRSLLSSNIDEADMKWLESMMRNRHFWSNLHWVTDGQWIVLSIGSSLYVGHATSLGIEFLASSRTIVFAHPLSEDEQESRAKAQLQPLLNDQHPGPLPDYFPVSRLVCMPVAPF